MQGKLSACVGLDFHPEMKQGKKGSQDALETKHKQKGTFSYKGATMEVEVMKEPRTMTNGRLDGPLCFYCLLE